MSAAREAASVGSPLLRLCSSQALLRTHGLMPVGFSGLTAFGDESAVGAAMATGMGVGWEVVMVDRVATTALSCLLSAPPCQVPGRVPSPSA